MDKIVTVRLIKADLSQSERFALLPHITDEDITRAKEYVSEEDRSARLLSAYLKRRYVGKWTTDGRGKPIADGVCFSVSHCKGAVALALADGDVGIDVECVRGVKDELKRRVAADSEYAGIKCDADFFAVWTAKESLAKAQGDGINRRPDKIPALPFDGEKRYKGGGYYSRLTFVGDLVISVTRAGTAPFDLEIIRESIPPCGGGSGV